MLELIEDLGIQYPTEISKEKKRFGLYKCICGKQFKATVQNVKTGKTKGCGCLREKHGASNHKLYSVWNSMMQRCNNPKDKFYKDYGGRGIKVCSEWLDVNAFISDMESSYRKGLKIDRIYNDKNYSKNNCRWVTQEIQSRNTRKIYAHNTSGYRGVTFFKETKKWRAQIAVNNKKINIGYFTYKLEAAKAYDQYVIDNNLEHTRNFE